MSSCCAAILLLTLQTWVFCYPPCGDEKDVSAIEGEDVILQVDETEIDDISWITDGAHIATTKPNNIIEIKSQNYKSKLYAEENSSLGIRNVIMEDSGTLKASIFKSKDTCSQSYHLSIYSNFSVHDLQILHNITTDKRCYISCVVMKPDVVCTCSSVTMGYKEQVSTLLLDDRTMNISWMCTAGNKLIKVSKIIEPWTLCYDEEDKTVMTGIIVGVFLIMLMGAACAYCRRKKRKKMMVPTTCTHENKPDNALYTESTYYEIETKRDSSAMTPGHKKMKPKEQREMEKSSIYTTLKNPSMGLVMEETLLVSVCNTIKAEEQDSKRTCHGSSCHNTTKLACVSTKWSRVESMPLQQM